MIPDSFDKGYIDYTVEKKNIDDLEKENIDLSTWGDGYLAFSNKELRLTDLPGDSDINTLLKDKITNINGIEGYLMEINLWGKNNEAYEEISIEREDSGFLYQRWKLHTELKENHEPNCYYRKVDTLPRKPIAGAERLFNSNELKSIEVIVSSGRLHFFITTGD